MLSDQDVLKHLRQLVELAVAADFDKDPAKRDACFAAIGKKTPSSANQDEALLTLNTPIDRDVAAALLGALTQVNAVANSQHCAGHTNALNQGLAAAWSAKLIGPVYDFERLVYRNRWEVMCPNSHPISIVADVGVGQTDLACPTTGCVFSGPITL